MSARSELSSRLRLIADMVDMNPCAMKEESFKSIDSGLSAIVSKQYKTFMSLEEVSLWIGVSIRTINRWQKTRGFPEGKIKGQNSLFFSIKEVTEWVRMHEKS